MTGYGSGGYGSVPWGGSGAPPPGVLMVADAVAENCIRLSFPSAVMKTLLGDSTDSLKPEKYSVQVSSVGETLDGSIARAVGVVMVSAIEGNDREVDLLLDRPMSHWPSIYTVTAYSIFTTLGIVIAPILTASCLGVKAAIVPPVRESYRSSRDFSNPTSLSGLLDPLPDTTALNLGTFAYGDDGDYAVDEGLENLRKRVIRRCVTKSGGFAWLPAYGVGVPQYCKKVASVATKAKLRAEIERQVALEPDVSAVRVAMRYSAQAPSAIWLYIRVRTKAGKGYQFDIPVTV